jgi:hypothetical protein
MVGWRTLGGLNGTHRFDRNPRRRMDSFLMKIIFFALMMLTSAVANAASPVYKWAKPPQTSDFIYPSADAACKAASPLFYAGALTNLGRDANCYFIQGNGYGTSVGRQSFGTCSDGSAPNTALPEAQQCADPIVCTPGREFSVTVSQGFKIPGTNKTSDMKAPTNINGCRVYASSEVVECKASPTGEVFCTWRATEGGVAPAGETPGSPAVMPTDATPDKVPEHNPALGQGCPKGTVSLGIDSTGQSICGGSGTSPATPTKTEVKEPTTNTTNADGSTTKVETTTRTNTDGSTTTTTKTTTTGADGKVTTTEGSVTGSKPGGAGGVGGGQGTSDAKDEDKSDLCKQHPELNICKNSEVSAGACAGGTDSTSCTGDAIQCAILREQKKQWCELNKENPSATLGNQAVAGNDPIKSTLPTKDNALTINMQSLDQSGFLGGGSCFQNKTVNMMGRSVVLPFSNVCPYLEWLRYVIMLIAALVSFAILKKPVLGD